MSSDSHAPMTPDALEAPLILTSEDELAWAAIDGDEIPRGRLSADQRRVSLGLLAQKVGTLRIELEAQRKARAKSESEHRAAVAALREQAERVKGHKTRTMSEDELVECSHAAPIDMARNQRKLDRLLREIAALREQEPAATCLRCGHAWHTPNECRICNGCEYPVPSFRPSASPEVAALREQTFTCAAKKGATADPPAECGWPLCGCDSYALKVLEAVQESGRVSALRGQTQDESEVRRWKDAWAGVDGRCEELSCELTTARAKFNKLLRFVQGLCQRDELAYSQPITEDEKHWWHVGHEHMKQTINAALEQAHYPAPAPQPRAPHQEAE